jgi:hypothetical protein
MNNNSTPISPLLRKLLVFERIIGSIYSIGEISKIKTEGTVVISLTHWKNFSLQQ